MRSGSSSGPVAEKRQKEERSILDVCRTVGQGREVRWARGSQSGAGLELWALQHWGLSDQKPEGRSWFILKARVKYNLWLPIGQRSQETRLAWEWSEDRGSLSVTQLCLTLCNPMDTCLPVHHQLPEFIQTLILWVGDAIQPSHPLLSPSPPAFNLSQHQGLFKWVSSSHQVAKVLEFQLQHQSFQWIFRTDFL